MSDYRVNFPVTGLALALEGLDALRAEMGLPQGALPGNALGDRRDASGDVVTPLPADDVSKPAPDVTAWIGRPGSAASSYKDMNGQDVEIPAKGDPSRYYIPYPHRQRRARLRSGRLRDGTHRSSHQRRRAGRLGGR